MNTESFNENAKVFRDSVKAIYIEITNTCNRLCTFCPNSDKARLKGVIDSIRIPWDVYERTLRQLSEINYSNTFGFHLYNEVLLDKEYLFKCLRASRELLPEACLTLFTNGDHLDLETLHDLVSSRVNLIHISLYASNHGKNYSKEGMLKRIRSKAKSLNLKVGKFETTQRGFHYLTKEGDVVVRIDASNYNEVGVGFDRGGLIESLNKYQRKTSCSSPEDQIIIDYQGNSLPCCNIHTSHKDYVRFVLGNIKKNDLLSLYFSKKHEMWRTGCKSAPPIFEICKTCSRGE